MVNIVRSGKNGEYYVESISQKEGNVLVKQQSRWNREVFFCIVMLKMCLFGSFGFALQFPFKDL